MERLEKDKTHPKNTSKHIYYVFKCGCGQTVSKRGDTKAKSCNQPGCTVSKRIHHGKSYSDLYSVWEGIKQRTGNPKANGAETYHGRGIKLCAAWQVFPAFEEWALTNGYEKGKTIDRMDINGDYTPSNCQFISRSENTKLQHKDGHGTSRPVYCSFAGREGVYFANKKACIHHIQAFGGKPAERKEKTISEAITRCIKQNKDYYGWTFKYE